MKLLRLWLLLSAVVIGALALWEFAPLLYFVALIALALGLLSRLMIRLAWGLKAWADRGWRRPQRSGGTDRC